MTLEGRRSNGAGQSDEELVVNDEDLVVKDEDLVVNDVVTCPSTAEANINTTTRVASVLVPFMVANVIDDRRPTNNN